MKLHEYQAKSLIGERGAAVPRGRVASTVEEALAAWREAGGGRVAVKAQIHAGGRGKAGGIKLATTEAEVRAAATAILGMTIVNNQTGPEGRLVRTVLVEEALEIETELYVAITLSRTRRRPLFVLSRFGGMDIEETAARDPRAVLREPFHPLTGLQAHQARRLAFALLAAESRDPRRVAALGALLTALARAYLDLDATLVEVNPLAVLRDGRIVCADAKVMIDECVLDRRKDLAALRDETEEEPAEREARQAHLSYVKLDGAIGCMVNGAGLAMATMDILKHFGGEPANFLDIGGGAKRERVTDALRIILTDPNVQGVFINIFGGIVRCDEVAAGVIAARDALGFSVPVTIRLTGTNEELGRRMLEEAGFTTGVDLNEAAEKAVRAVAS